MQALLAEPGEAEQSGDPQRQGLSSCEMGRGRQEWSSLSLPLLPELPPPTSVTRHGLSWAEATKSQ